MRDKSNSKSLLSTGQDARISVGIHRGKKSGEKEIVFGGEVEGFAEAES